MESEEQSERNSEHDGPKEQVEASSDNERAVSTSTVSFDMRADTVDQIKLTKDVHEREGTTYLENVTEVDVRDVLENDRGFQETEQSMDDSKMQNTKQLSDLPDSTPCKEFENESMNLAPDALNDMLFSQNSEAPDNSDAEKQPDRAVSPPISPRSPVRLPLVKIIISPPSTTDLKIHTEHPREVITQESNGVQDDLDTMPVNVDATVSGEVESSLSLEFDTSGGGKGYIELSNVSREDASDASTCREKLLFSTSDETDVDIEMEFVPPVGKYDAGQYSPKTKPDFEHFQTDQKLLLKRQKSHSPDEAAVKDFLEPHESMEEIDLNEGSFICDFEQTDQAIREPSLPDKEQSKYSEVLGTCYTTDFLKHCVMKGVLAQGVKMKEVINEKLNRTTAKPCQENPVPNKSASLTDDLLPCLTSSDTLNITTLDTRLSKVTPYLILSEKNLTRDQCLKDDFSASTYHSNKQIVHFNSTVKDQSIANIVHFSKRNDPTCESPISPGLLHHLEANEQNKHSHVRPEPSAPFVHSTITQSPGPMRGYTAFYPTPYGVPVPPSLPPPPTVPAEDYFASRYYSGRFFPPTSPSRDHPTEDIDRKNFNDMESPESNLTKSMDYMTSFVRLKSSQVKDDLNRKLSSSVSQTSRTIPIMRDIFAEEGRVQRSSMDSGSDQFQHPGIRTITTDDLLKGVVCCCFWPLGLAARMFALTVQDRGGPVDTCVKALSHQLSIFTLVLGIATYFIFFMLWLSLIVVTTNSN